MQAAWAAMRMDMTELEVAEVAHKSFRTAGARPLFTIVCAGPNGAFPHHESGKTVLREGDPVVMDIGGAREGYSSGITWMAAMGTLPRAMARSTAS